jgi:hypothetical protein
VQRLRAILSRGLSHCLDCDKSRRCYAISFSAVRRGLPERDIAYRDISRATDLHFISRDTRRERTGPR